MKTKTNPFLSFPSLALAGVISLSTSAVAAVNNWNTTTGTWDTSTANWLSPTTWTNGNDATFAKDATASTITLSSGLTAGSVKVGNGGNNAKYTFTGSGLSATSFTVEGDGNNNLTNNPTAAFNNASITLSGALNIGRAYLNITGNSIVSADTIGSPAGGDGTGAWGTLTIADTASVTATNGFSIGTTAWGLNLNGGTLTTKNLSYSPHSFSGTTNLNFNGTLIKANQDIANFIVVGSGGLDAGFNPNIQAGGAKFDTNTFTIGIGVALQGTGALTKSGSGTLNLNVANSYSGGTIVDGGTLSLNHEPTGIANTAIGAMSSSNTVTINNGGVLTSDGLRNNWLSNTGLASGGSNAISVTVNQGGTLKGGTGRITGLGNVTLNGGTIEVSNGLVSGSWNGSFTLGGDITVSGTAASSITTASGSTASANLQMSNGSNGVGGTRTFTVNDVTSNAASDLVVSARLANGTVIKAGTGTLELATGATGTGVAVNWTINAGTVLASAASVVGGAVTVEGASAVLDIAGNNQTSVGAVTLKSGSINGSTGILTASSYAAESGSISALLAGTGGFTKSTADTVTLSGSANTFTGGVTVSGGTLLLSKGSDVASIAAGNAVLVNTGGTIKLGNSGQIAEGITSFTLNGGTFDLDTRTEGFDPAVTMDNGTITGTSAGFILARSGYVGTGTNTISQRVSTRASDANSGKFDITSGTTTVSGAIYVDQFGGTSGGITKTGAGTLTLSNNTNSYTGATQVNGGILNVTGTTASASAVSVGGASATGTPKLTGSGTINGAVTVKSAGVGGAAGTLSAGDSTSSSKVGTLTMGSTLAFESGSIFEWDINANKSGVTGTAGTDFDKVSVNGNITVDNAAIFKVVFGTGVSMADVFWSTTYATQTWDIATIFGKSFNSGAFAPTVQTSTDVSSYGSFTINGTSLTWSAVPEPTSALAGLLIAAGLLRRRRA